MKLSLGAKLIGAAVLLLVVTVVTSTWLNVRAMQRISSLLVTEWQGQAKESLEGHASSLARNLAAATSVPLAAGDYSLLSSLVNRASNENRSIEWVLVTDAETDRVLARTERAPTLTVYAGDLAPRLRESERGPEPTTLHRAEGVFATNLVVADRTVGRLYMSVTTKELEAAVAGSLGRASAQSGSLIRNQLLTAAIILVVGVLLAWYQGARISRPIRALSVQASHVAGGDFDKRVQVRSNDEIGTLARDFNAMAESLGRLLREMANKAVLERELELARNVQALMSPPPHLHEVGPFRITGTCRLAAQCGGDWWSYLQLSGGRVLLVVGDVTGHGIPAAIIAATARGALDGLSSVSEVTSAEQVLRAIDRAVRDVGRGQLFMTCFACILDPAAGSMEFANAGHVFPYTAQLHGDRLGALGVLAVAGNPLGTEVVHLKTGRRPLSPGDVFILASDGLTDRLGPDGKRYDNKRMRRALLSPLVPDRTRASESLRDGILADADAFAEGRAMDDDLTLVVCHYPEI